MKNKRKEGLVFILTVLISLGLWLSIQSALLSGMKQMHFYRIIPFDLMQTVPSVLTILFANYLVLAAHSVSLFLVHFRLSSLHKQLNYSSRAIATSWVFIMRWLSFGLVFFPTWWMHHDKMLYTLLILILVLINLWIILDYGMYWRRKLKVNWRKTFRMLTAILVGSFLLSLIRIPEYKKFKFQVENDPSYLIRAQRPKIHNGDFIRLSCGKGYRFQVGLNSPESAYSLFKDGKRMSTVEIKTLQEEFATIREYCFPSILLESDSLTKWKDIHGLIEILKTKPRSMLSLMAYDTSSITWAGFSDPDFGLSLWVIGSPKEEIDSFYQFKLVSQIEQSVTVVIGGEVELDIPTLTKRLKAIPEKRKLLILDISDETRIHDVIHALDDIIGMIQESFMDEDRNKMVHLFLKEDMDVLKQRMVADSMQMLEK